jgi:CRP-like cAMP-binding protein
VLANYFSRPLLQKLALKVREHSYGPDELIFKADEIVVPSIYILFKGEVELFLETGLKQNLKIRPFKQLNRPYDYFGHLEFFTQNF